MTGSQPPTTTEATLKAVTWKGAYIGRQALADLNALFARADGEGRGDFDRAPEAAKRLFEGDPHMTAHYG